jgi:pyruvate ferredoxin oxidoreductase beta subunit/2-oxoisovalerate ferredoxin oxidoreductase beta subunit
MSTSVSQTGNQDLDWYGNAELVAPGHLGCAGCGGSLAMRLVLKGLGRKTIAVIPACCWSLIPGVFPYNALEVPLLHTAFETTAAAASGVSAALAALGETETTVLGWAGDGGTFDIGLQALSGAAERNDDFMYVCYDNEAYMNTGTHRSSATPWGAWTMTTPGTAPKDVPKKDIVAILAAHGIPYIATASVAFPHDLMAKVTKAKAMKGTRFLHILSPCPPGWKTDPQDTVRLARLAVETRVFPLYEVLDGQRYAITYQPKGLPVSHYLLPQGRFRGFGDHELAMVQDSVDRNWQRLLRLAGVSE